MPFIHHNIIVNIYLDNTLDNAITSYRVPISDVVTPYTSVTSAVPSGSNFVHNVPFDLFLPAATAFTVEVISPASQDFMIGYNDSGVTNEPDATALAFFLHAPLNQRLNIALEYLPEK